MMMATCKPFPPTATGGLVSFMPVARDMDGSFAPRISSAP
jgi:hypothetical protein